MTPQQERLAAADYNARAIAYIETQIALGNGTLDQWCFSALNLGKLDAINARYADFVAPAVPPEGEMTLTVRVRPNGSYANYLAYGVMLPSGTFKRHGYPKDILKPTYGERWGKPGGNQYEYEVTFRVPAAFLFVIVKVSDASAVQTARVEVLYTPAAVPTT